MDWKRKLGSRKLWAAIAGIVGGLTMVFGLDENIISTVSGAVVSLASIITYICTEGKIDAADLAAKTAQAVGDAAEAVQMVRDDENDR